MAEGDLVALHFACDAVENAAAETGAERADVAAFRDQALDDGVGVLILDVVFDVDVLEVLLECFTGEVGDVLVDIDGNEIELDRRALLERPEGIEKHEAVLAAAHGDHDAVTVLNHAEVGDGLGCEADDSLLKLFDGNRLLIAVAGTHVDAVLAVLEDLAVFVERTRGDVGDGDDGDAVLAVVVHDLKGVRGVGARLRCRRRRHVRRLRSWRRKRGATVRRAVSPACRQWRPREFLAG